LQIDRAYEETVAINDAFETKRATASMQNKGATAMMGHDPGVSTQVMGPMQVCRTAANPHNRLSQRGMQIPASQTCLKSLPENACVGETKTPDRERNQASTLPVPLCMPHKKRHFAAPNASSTQHQVSDRRKRGCAAKWVAQHFRQQPAQQQSAPMIDDPTQAKRGSNGI
jgi:hypothetical protein